MDNDPGNHERALANPEAADLVRAKGARRTSSVAPTEGSDGMLGRVADAGDIGEGDPSPYGIAIQAEIIAGQTMQAQTVEAEAANDKPQPSQVRRPRKPT